MRYARVKLSSNFLRNLLVSRKKFLNVSITYNCFLFILDYFLGSDCIISVNLRSC